MAFYYITGTPGAGKSAILAELKQRGFAAYEADDLAAFYNKQTGQAITGNVTAAERTPAWRKQYVWKIPSEKIDTLVAEATSHDIFLCGVVANDAEFWNRFARVFCLYVPPAELERRLTSRGREDGHAYGKNAHELANALEWAGYAKRQYTDLGATIIDATQSVGSIIDQILGLIT